MKTTTIQELLFGLKSNQRNLVREILGFSTEPLWKATENSNQASRELIENITQKVLVFPEMVTESVEILLSPISCSIIIHVTNQGQKRNYLISFMSKGEEELCAFVSTEPGFHIKKYECAVQRKTKTLDCIHQLIEKAKLNSFAYAA